MNKRGAGKHIEGTQTEERWIESSTSARKIRLCIYRPLTGGENLPTLLYIHGGGYAMGSPEMSASAIQKFMAACPCVIIAPSYCCSLEEPCPAAIDDCYDALLWTKKTLTALTGIPVEFEEFLGGFHGFEVLVPSAKVSQRLTVSFTALLHGPSKLTSNKTEQALGE